MSRAGDLVEPDDGLHLRLVAQAALQQAGVAQHERRDRADALRAAVVFRHEVEGFGERILHRFFLEYSAGAPHCVSDLVGDDLTGPAEPDEAAATCA